MPLSPEDRSALIVGILDMGLEFMAATFLSDENDFGVMADQMVKGLLATGAMMGFFNKDPELGKIYRDSSIKSPTEKGLKIVKQFCKGMVDDPEFHAKTGVWVDEKLGQMFHLFCEKFGVGMMEEQSESTA